jgi:hypothetical protein
MATSLATPWLAGYASPDDIYIAAYDGVIDALYDERFQARRGWVISFAANRARRHVQTNMRQHGVSLTGSTQGTMPSFVKYWDQRQVEPSPESEVVDRLAFQEAWDRLNAFDKATLVVAAGRTPTELAKRWRCSQRTASERVKAAYAAFDLLLNGRVIPRQYALGKRRTT